MYVMTDEECATYDRLHFPDGFDETQWQANRDRPMPDIQMIDVAKLEAEEAVGAAEEAQFCDHSGGSVVLFKWVHYCKECGRAVDR